MFLPVYQWHLELTESLGDQVVGFTIYMLRDAIQIAVACCRDMWYMYDADPTVETLSEANPTA
jgi:hypothetical protein